MGRPPITGLRHLAISVSDVDGMVRFYCEVLGFEVEWRPDPDNAYLRSASGGDSLALHRYDPPSAVDLELFRAARAQRLGHLGLVVPRPENVDAWAVYLAELGVKLDREPKTHRDGARSLYLSDPEGNSIQILYHPPISGDAP